MKIKYVLINIDLYNGNEIKRIEFTDLMSAIDKHKEVRYSTSLSFWDILVEYDES